MRHFPLSLFLLIVSFCSEKTEDAQIFRIPKITTLPHPDSLHLFEAKSISITYAFIHGMYSFIDTINFSERQKNSLFHPFENREKFISLDTFSNDGLELYPDYNTAVYLPSRGGTHYYPVYLVNHTRKIKTLEGHDAQVHAIQEALDSNQRWHPIEAQAFWACSYWKTTFPPQSFSLLVFPKYKGDFKTKLRVRVRNGDQVFISQAFDGWIDYGQFNMSDEVYNHCRHAPFLKLSGEIFHGALPRDVEYDEEAFMKKVKAAVSPATGL